MSATERFDPARVYTLAEMQAFWADWNRTDDFRSSEGIERLLEDACAMLCDVEWNGGGGRTDAEYCISCRTRNDHPGRVECRSHADDCELQKLLVRAGWR